MTKQALLILRMLVLALASSELSATAPATQPASAAGIWLGTLQAGGRELRLLVKLHDKGPEGWAGTLNSLDQTAIETPLRSVKVEGRNVRFELHARAWFEGELSEDGAELAGFWNQIGAFRLRFSRQESEPRFPRPQDPIPPFPYQIREVRFENPAAGATLAGTLTIPPGPGPHPAVVLISGSGAQNRDGECFGHRPFAVLADHLSRHGIAVLRHDDRGVGQSTGDRSRATSADFAEDALAAVAFLRLQSEIDPHRVGLVGHSEGGLIAPLAAVKSSEVAFIALLAGPGLRGKEILLEQNRTVLSLAKAPPMLIDAHLKLAEAVMQTVIDEPDDALARQRIEA
ncbi:MAG: alpha/beta fold hydrolase, partial [Phycisphaerae bacterium]|nr:alpha/beta fold hydrolase [Phycisphaerae bacterium]